MIVVDHTHMILVFAPPRWYLRLLAGIFAPSLVFAPPRWYFRTRLCLLAVEHLSTAEHLCPLIVSLERS